MKKRLFAIIFALAAALCCIGLFAACSDNSEKSELMTVTFYDGDSVLFTQEVEKGGKAKRPESDPQKDGYIFIDWYGTPTFTHIYDFDRIIDGDVSVFAGFAKHENDTREYYLLGNGTSQLLYKSNWGNFYNEDYKMTKSASDTENIYTFTVDLAAGDEFVFALPGWGYKHGAGYIVNRTLDGKECFDEGDKLSNIKVLVSGNYTFTMKTYPAHLNWGEYDPDDENAVYNVTGSFDTIEVVRNGDMISGPVELTVSYYIKGNGLTNWLDVYNPYLQMSDGDGDGVYTLSIYLEEGEEFMFGSANTATDGTVAAGTASIKFENLDEVSGKLFSESGGNLKANAAGMYTFSYNDESKELSVSFDDEKAATQEDYYLDGTFGDGQDWQHRYDDAGTLALSDAYKLQETDTGSGVYMLSGIALEAGDEITLFAYKAGAEAEGTYGSEDYALLGSYDFRYLHGAGELFAAVGNKNNNISVVVAGTYDITFDSYSKIMTIKSQEAGYDVYINGQEITGWNHNFAEEFKFSRSDENTSEYILTVALTKGDSFGLFKFDEGSQEGFGDFIGPGFAGEEGETQSFVPSQGSNFVVPESGTYKIVFDSAKETVQIYKVTD